MAGGTHLPQPKVGTGPGPHSGARPCPAAPSPKDVLSWVSAPEHCSDLHNIKLLMGFQCTCVQVCVWSCVIIRSLWDPQTYHALLSSLSLPQKAS